MEIVMDESLPRRSLKLLVTTIFLFLLYFAVVSFYNLFLHPLRRIPGPLLARVSRLWSRIGNFYGCKSERIHAAHLKFGQFGISISTFPRSQSMLTKADVNEGPVVRIGPKELSFADPAAVREIYTSDIFLKEESFYVCLETSCLLFS